MSTEKRASLARAKELLSSPDQNAIRYAALDLRLCMEAITYEKLRGYASIIPEEVLAKWQPPQAVKALLEFEPNGDKSFTLFAGIEDRYGEPAKQMHLVGEHRALGYGWLRKHYNKVGHLLHVQSSSKSISSEDTKKSAVYLNEVVTDLEQVLAGKILSGALREVFEFKCKVCGQPVVCNVKATTKSNKAVCLNPQCAAEYFATISENGDACFALKVTEFDCQSCQALIPVENRKLEIGFTFKCGSCGLSHVIESRTWSYSREDS